MACSRPSHLRLRGHAAYFDETEAKVKETIDGFCLLVEASCQSNGVDDGHAKEL